MSIEAESDLLGKIMGKIDLISSPNQLLANKASRDSIRDTFPRRVLISPL